MRIRTMLLAACGQSGMSTGRCNAASRGGLLNDFECYADGSKLALRLRTTTLSALDGSTIAGMNRGAHICSVNNVLPKAPSVPRTISSLCRQKQSRSVKSTMVPRRLPEMVKARHQAQPRRLLVPPRRRCQRLATTARSPRRGRHLVKAPITVR